ncbi:MAG TPA: Uma2 family endonuclease [Geminicoccaceae bacterium]
MPQPRPDWPKTLDEFRAWQQRQPEVWEFIDGVPKLMAPGSMAHTLLKTNAGRLLGNAIPQTGCRVLVDGAIIEVEGSSLIPDVVVTCSELDFTTPRVDDPIIIVEVLSPSNEKDDVGRKLALYLKIGSLRHYLVIHQDRRLVVHHQRRDDLDGAFLTTIAPPDPLRLDAPGIEIPLAAIYDGVPIA